MPAAKPTTPAASLAVLSEVCTRFRKHADLNLSAALDLAREASALLDNGRTDFSF